MNPASWEQAKDVITEALRHAPADREQFVRQRCADTTLAEEIITLINAYGTEGDFLADPRSGESGAGGDDELEPGTRIGPYVIIDSIGRGGMGHVFLGSDPRLRRKVALKCVIRSLAGSGERRLRILHEARAAASVAHPNVATIHDVVEHDNRAFIVMEYVEGESLAARMKRERLPIDRVIAIGRQLASALAAAHARRVVHRDLKPGNVHFANDGTVKVLDFGIANVPRLATTVAPNRSTGATSQPTVPGAQPGTPPYMSPEQLMGRRVDERSDIYSLGVVLFEMATGRRPHLETDAASLVVAMASGTPRADRVDRQVPDDLAEVIARALAIDVEARYQSAAEVGAQLERVEVNLRERQKGAAELIQRWATRVAAGMLMAPPALVSLGFLNSMTFNITLSRTGPFGAFGHETTWDYFVWGVRSVVPMLAYVLMATIVSGVARFGLRMSLLHPGLNAAVTRLRGRLRSAVTRMGMDDPVVMAQALATLGIVAIALVIWWFRDLTGAWTGGYINSTPTEWFRPLSNKNPERGYYRIVVTLLAAGFGVALLRTIRLRRRRQTKGGLGPLLMLVAVVATLIVMANLPYRLFSHSEFERVDYGSLRCYDIGRAADELLVYCPELGPPRNRIIKQSDPSLRRLGIVESIFTPQPSGRPGF